jgi:hypothetical protein
MSLQDVDKFREEIIMKDPALKEQIEHATSVDDAARRLFQAGHKKGYKFTLKEAQEKIQQVLQEKKKKLPATLTDDELETVVSGAFTDNWGCAKF